MCKKLQALQFVYEDGPLDDRDAFLESLLLDFAVSRLFAHPREGGHVLGPPQAELLQNGQEVHQ